MWSNLSGLEKYYVGVTLLEACITDITDNLSTKQHQTDLEYGTMMVVSGDHYLNTGQCKLKKTEQSHRNSG